MPDLVDVNEAESDFASLVTRVEAGEEILIAREGQPVAWLVPVRAPMIPRRPGLWRGRVRLAPDFDSTDEELASTFGA
jgi:prevent-host-death family protein